MNIKKNIMNRLNIRTFTLFYFDIATFIKLLRNYRLEYRYMNRNGNILFILKK